MASNEKVVLCGITFDKDDAPFLSGLGRMEDGTFYGKSMEDYIEYLAIIDKHIPDGSIYIDFLNKEVWVYYKNYCQRGYSKWQGPDDTICLDSYYYPKDFMK